jgi:hypothetical protein
VFDASHTFVLPTKRLASLARSTHDSSAPLRAIHSFMSRRERVSPRH